MGFFPKEGVDETFSIDHQLRKCKRLSYTRRKRKTIDNTGPYCSMRKDEATASSWFWLFFFFFRRNFNSLRRLKTWSPTSMANARLKGLTLAYIHKPTEIDSSFVLKQWDASGHRQIALAFSNIKNKRRAKNFHFNFLTVKGEVYYC